MISVGSMQSIKGETVYLHKKFWIIDSLLLINMYPLKLQLPNGLVWLKSVLVARCNFLFTYYLCKSTKEKTPYNHKSWLAYG